MISKPNSVSPESSPTESPQSPSASGIIEVDLVQHYLDHTAHRWDVSSSSTQTFWRSVVPALAFTSRTVRLGLLTAAALCIHNDRRCEGQSNIHYLIAAEYYGEQFVELSNKQLHTLDEENVEVNLVISRQLAALAFPFFRVHQRHNGIDILHPAAWTWMHMLRGVQTVYIHYRHSNVRVNENLAKELAAEKSTDVIQAFQFNPYFSFIERTRHERFAALYDAVIARSSNLDEQQASDMRGGISALQEVVDNMCATETVSLLRSLLMWPVKIPRGFTDLLTSGDLLALAIHTHWLMLVVLAEDNWVIDDMGRSGIFEISALCEADPAADVERELVEWPKKMLREEIDLTGNINLTSMPMMF